MKLFNRFNFVRLHKWQKKIRVDLTFTPIFITTQAITKALSFPHLSIYLFFSVYFFSLYFWALNCNLFEFFSITRAVFLFGRVSVMLVITIYCALIGIRREVLLHDNMAFGINKLKWDQIDVDLKISKSHIERTPLIRYVCKYFATLSSLSHPTDGFS